MGMIPSALFNPASVATMQSLNSEGAASLLLRDSLQNIGIVKASKKENQDLGDEVSTIMWGSWLIWGGGSFLLQKMMFSGMNPVAPLAKDADSSIMDADKGIQQLTKEDIAAYSKNLQTRFASDSKILQAQGKNLAQDYMKLAKKDAGTFLKHMNSAKLATVVVSGLIPAWLTGVTLPQIAQEHSKKKLTQRATDKHVLSLQQEKAQETSLHAQLQKADAFNQTNPTTKLNNDEGDSVAPRNALLWKGVNYLNNNMTMTNLVFVDSAVTGGRVATAEDPTDRVRWATYEAIFLYMMYFGSAQVRSMIHRGVMKAPGFKDFAHLKQMSFPSLAAIREAADPKSATNGMKQGLHEGIKALGITPQQHKEMIEAYEQYTLHHSLNNNHKTAEAEKRVNKATEPVIASIRKQMIHSKTPYTKGDNMIIDMMIHESALPVHREGFWSALGNGRSFDPKILGIDITRPIKALDGEGESGVANVVYRMKQLSEHSSDDVMKMVKSSYAGHAIGIGASLVAGYVVMGQMSPWVQSWLSNKVTGQKLPGRLDEKHYHIGEDGNVKMAIENPDQEKKDKRLSLEG